MMVDLFLSIFLPILVLSFMAIGWVFVLRHLARSAGWQDLAHVYGFPESLGGHRLSYQSEELNE